MKIVLSFIFQTLGWTLMGVERMTKTWEFGIAGLMIFAASLIVPLVAWWDSGVA